MNIKKLTKKSKPTPELSITDLNRSVSHSFFRKFKIRVHSLVGRLKRFYKDYRLPSIASMAFLFLILVFAFVRQLERTSLIALRNEVTNGGNGYSILLSADDADQFTRNDTTENQQNNQPNIENNLPESNSTQSTSNSFTLITSGSTTTSSNSGSGSSSTGGDSGSGTGSSGGVTLPQADPFEAKIDSFSQGDVVLQCTNPSRPKKGSCSKLYTVSAGVKTLNGPGSVSYNWQSNIDAGNGSGNFQAGDGSTITSVSKGITLSCTKDSSFTIQIALISPTFSNSNTITINHNCNEL